MAPSRLGPNKTGIALGVLMGGWHLLWSLLVAIGFAQVILNFVFWIHFIKPVYIVEPFRLELAAVLVVVTALIGYVSGYLFAAIWNWTHRA